VTSARARREELEALCWRNSLPAPLVAEILAAADAYVKASRPRAPKKPAEPKKPPAVHHAVEGRGHPACRPHDPFSSRNWAVSGDVRDVTCGHCLKISARQEAGAA
jgi:hypothetical protein